MRDRLVAPSILLVIVLAACGPSALEPPSDGRRSVAVSVGASGYSPGVISAAPGEAIRLVFTRTTDDGCGQQVVFPEQGLREDLPLGQPVAVDLTVPVSGQVRFTCGMDMYDGAIVIR